MKSLIAFAFLAIAATPALSVAIYGQCGGIGYTGDTTCDAGTVCTVLNAYYSQCLAGTATTTAPGSSSTTPTGTTSASAPASSGTGTCSSTRTKFQFFGVNESCAEFGNTVIPGVLGTDYTWASPSSIDYFVSEGMNFFRMPFLMERLVPPATGMTGPFDPTYFSGLQTTAEYITGKGAYVALDPHNYMSYNGAVISSTSDFETFWKNLAAEFVDNENVIFDLMNEPNGIDAGVVFDLMQAGVNGVRSAGATQLILVEGTSWTGAWTWESSGNSEYFANISDPLDNFAIEMHQYLDSDGSGTSATCVSSTIGAERLQVATEWLQSTGLKGFLGEIGAGNDQTCIDAVYGAMCAMQESGVWIGASWWAAGPWWGTYYQSIEPPSGQALTGIMPDALLPFV